jgi:hypothetical protein
MTDLNEITKNLYLGDQYVAKNIKALSSLNIKHIIVAG